jgi:hypothetical protein
VVEYVTKTASQLDAEIAAALALPPGASRARGIMHVLGDAVSVAAEAYDKAARQLALLRAVRRPGDSTKHRFKIADAQRRYEATAGAYNDARVALEEYRRTGAVRR